VGGRRVGANNSAHVVRPARNTGLRHHRTVVTAGPAGLVTLTGTVSTQSLRREVELALLDESGVRSLHDNLIVGR
jgi:hypothetical protein